MSESSVSPSSSWEQVVLPRSYINPARLKIYLDAEFPEDYLVQQIGDQFYIRTRKPLTPAQLDEIRHLRMTFRTNPKYTKKASGDDATGETGVIRRVGTGETQQHDLGTNSETEREPGSSPPKSNRHRTLTQRLWKN